MPLYIKGINHYLQGNTLLVKDDSVVTDKGGFYMEEYNISVKNREEAGTSAVRKMKREGMVPGVLYREDKGIPITFVRDEIKPILDKKGKDVLLNVDFNGQKIKAKVQEIQRESINDEILHVDLMPFDQVKH